MKRPLAILMLSFIATVGMIGAAAADTSISNNTVSNNTLNIPIAANVLSGNSVNVIRNNNTFDPVIVNVNRNSIRDISVRSTNTNLQAQLGSRSSLRFTNVKVIKVTNIRLNRAEE